MTLFEGSQGFTCKFTVLENGRALNLAGYAVTLVVQNVGEFECAMIDAAKGRVDYVTTGEEFMAGEYPAQLRLDKPGERFPSSRFPFVVKPVLVGG